MKNSLPKETPWGRTGTVHLELVLFMPLLSAMLAGLMAVAEYGRTRTNAISGSRKAAWSVPRRRLGLIRLPYEGSEQLEAIGRVLNDEQPAARGLAVGQADRTTEKATSFGAGSTTAKYSIFRDTWDYQALRFENRDARKAMSLDTRAKIFLTGPVRLGSMSALLDVSGSSLLKPVVDAIKNVEGLLTSAIERRQVLVNDSSREVRSLEAELRTLLSQRPRNRGAIQKTEVALSRAREQLKARRGTLNKVKDRARQVRHHLDWVPEAVPDSDELDDDFFDLLP